MEAVVSLTTALGELARNKMRSGLTMLGIVIGVGAVIATVGLGQGASGQVQSQIASMGSNLLFVGSGSLNRGGLRTGAGQTKSLTYDDMVAITRECPSVAAAAPGTSAGVQVVFGNANWSTQITGTTPSFFDIRAWALESGSVFADSDVKFASNVAVIGATVRKNLFGDGAAVGQRIRIKNLPFTVIGVLASKGQSGGMGQDQDDAIYAPITTVQRKITGQDWVQYISVSAESREATYAAQEQIEALLRDRHRIRAGQDDDFNVRNLADLANLASQTGRVLTLLLAGIAGVSLLVGGIGIMNIMLVSVTERTREIGIRRAIGATGKDVQRQFLIEAVTISALGGVVGIGVGVLALLAITAALDWNLQLSMTAIAVAVVFSTAVGVFFGLYPAKRAASLDPIEALRYE